jgi:hypothetical protein
MAIYQNKLGHLQYQLARITYNQQGTMNFTTLLKPTVLPTIPSSPPPPSFENTLNWLPPVYPYKCLPKPPDLCSYKLRDGEVPTPPLFRHSFSWEPCCFSCKNPCGKLDLRGLSSRYRALLTLSDSVAVDSDLALV